MRVLITLFLVAVLAAAGFAAWQVYVPFTPPTGQTFVMLRSGYSTRRIAVELKKAGVIRSELAFRLWHIAHPKPTLKAGEYLFEKEATLPQVYGRIARGDIYFHVVTIPEGYTMFDIAQAIEDAGLGSAADFLHIAETQTQLIADIAPDAQSLEGYLFPNTYEFTRTQTLEEMAAAMVHQFRQVAQQVGMLSGDIAGSLPNGTGAVVAGLRHQPGRNHGVDCRKGNGGPGGAARAWPASITTGWRNTWRSMPIRA